MSNTTWADDYSSDEGSIDQERDQPQYRNTSDERAVGLPRDTSSAPSQGPYVLAIANINYAASRKDVGVFFEKKGCKIANLDLNTRPDGTFAGSAVMEFNDRDSMGLGLRMNGELFMDKALRTKAWEERPRRHLGAEGGGPHRDGRGRHAGGRLDSGGRSTGNDHYQHQENFRHRQQQEQRDYARKGRDFNQSGPPRDFRDRGPARDRSREVDHRVSKDPAHVPPAAERPRIVLQPRTLPLEDVGKVTVAPTSIFGAGKPQDETRYEEFRKHHQLKKEHATGDDSDAAQAHPRAQGADGPSEEAVSVAPPPPPADKGTQVWNRNRDRNSHGGVEQNSRGGRGRGRDGGRGRRNPEGGGRGRGSLAAGADYPPDAAATVPSASPVPSCPAPSSAPPPAPAVPPASASASSSGLLVVPPDEDLPRDTVDGAVARGGGRGGGRRGGRGGGRESGRTDRTEGRGSRGGRDGREGRGRVKGSEPSADQGDARGGREGDAHPPPSADAASARSDRKGAGRLFSAAAKDGRLLDESKQKRGGPAAHGSTPGSGSQRSAFKGKDRSKKGPSPVAQADSVSNAATPIAADASSGQGNKVLTEEERFRRAQLQFADKRQSAAAATSGSQGLASKKTSNSFAVLGLEEDDD